MTVALFALLSAMPANPAGAQAAVDVPDEPACDGCRIVMRPVALLGHDSDADGPFENARVVRDGRGRFYVAPSTSRTQILDYGRGGRLRRLIGRAGSGPGEFMFPTQIRPCGGDSLCVFDYALLRMTVLDPDGEVARTLALPALPIDAVLLRGGDLVLHARVANAERVGLPLHLVGSDGVARRSFGAAEAAPVRPDRPYEEMRALARARDGVSVWTMRINRYQIERWDTAGRPTVAFDRDPAWFEPWDVAPRHPVDQVRPVPWTAGIVEDRDGLLWVFVSVAATGWTPAPGAAERDPRREQSFVPLAERGRYVDTMVEVIDPAAGRVVARARSPRYLLPAESANGDILLHARLETTRGGEQIRVWKVELRKP